MHLSGKADTFYVFGIYPALGDDFTDGTGGSFLPVLGILFGPAVLGLIQGVVSRSFGNRTALLIIEHGLGSRGSYVYTNQVIHFKFLLKWFYDCYWRACARKITVINIAQDKTRINTFCVTIFYFM